MNRDEAAQAFREFVAVIQALRTPGTGCPWDLEQNHQTLRPYLIEEAYEVLDAIDRGKDQAFRDELGDLLLQVVLHAQVADDRGAFSITEVVRRITEKMVRRHPHVFGSVRVTGSADVRRNWEQIKAAEAQGEGSEPSHGDTLARIPENLPALLRAQRIGEKAAKVRGEETSVAAVLNQVREQVAELEEEIRTAMASLPAGVPDSAEAALRLPEERRIRLEQELGEVLFSLCQLTRWLGLSAEDSLRACIQRFVDRFRHREAQVAQALPPGSRGERSDSSNER